MMQPLVLPPEVTGRVPRPENGTPGVGFGGAPVEVIIVVDGGGTKPLGRYLTPVAGQLDLDPSKRVNGSQELQGIHLTWIRRYIFPSLHAASDIEEIPYLIEFAIPALDSDFNASGLGKRCQYFGGRVGLGGRWDDASSRQERVGVELLEQLDRLLEVGDHFLLRNVVFVARWFQRAYAGSVLVPFVFPKVFVIALVIFPEDIHVGQ